MVRMMHKKAWRLFMIDEPTLAGLNGLMPEHGLDASELASLFSRLVIGSKMQAQGYEHNEHAGFFIDLEQPTQSQARFPVFLAKISNPSKAKSWTLAKAKQEWYWGYIWSGGGLNTKAIFDDWMWWCSSLHLLKIEDVSVKIPRWIPVPRAELANAIEEAKARGEDVSSAQRNLDKAMLVVKDIPSLWHGFNLKDFDKQVQEGIDSARKAEYMASGVEPTVNPTPGVGIVVVLGIFSVLYLIMRIRKGL